jgi:hypothetical protein
VFSKLTFEGVLRLYLQGQFEKFVDWLQCATVMPSCSGGGDVVVA